ncbi:MAG: FAD-dependent oxidoreductase [Candidatus Hermodarchaeota archaeon]|nr:FAD-dependent oxidoreductase [Candidatus Hermodarchaeota archaeon]
MVENRDLIIVGCGPGGMTAGLYAARMGLQAVILETGICGGRMINAWQIENYPGFENISGGDLSMKMKAQAEHAGAEIREMITVEKLQLSENTKIAITSEGTEWHAPAIILAMGACDAELGVPGETEYHGRGISYCATCDGPLFRGKTVVIVGGGNTAAMDALFLTNIVEKVYLVHRRDELRAEQAYADRLISTPNVEILWDTILLEVIGKDVVSGAKLRNKKTGREWVQEADGVFIAVGCQPNSTFCEPAGIQLDKSGNILVDANQQTNIPGVYAVGDITGEPRQIVRACGDAVKAVTHWLTVRPPK